MKNYYNTNKQFVMQSIYNFKLNNNVNSHYQDQMVIIKNKLLTIYEEEINFKL